ncbi:MAG: low temperature requirement protein A, partial [Pseudonocardiaceae bacterium]
GLFTLIVLGEVVAAATVAVQSGFSTHGLSVSLLLVAVGGLLLVFGVWWSYFKHDVTGGLRGSSLRSVLLWGYGHYGVFAAIAALGAGLEVVAVAIERHTELSAVAAALCVAVPTAVYLLIAGPLQAQLNPVGALKQRYVVLAAALMLLIAAGASLFTLPLAVLLMGVLLAALVTIGVISAHRAERAGG